MAKQTLGKLPADAFGMLELPALPAGVLDGYRALPDLIGIVSDVLDELGVVGAIAAAVLRPTDPKARSVSPITGKWRVETIAINKPVAICGITVHPGDVVLADQTGVCFVPRARAAEVLQRAQRNVAAEEAREAKIASGAPVPELFGKAR